MQHPMIRTQVALPRKGTSVSDDDTDNRAQLEQLGFGFGDQLPDDMVACTLPAGWSVRSILDILGIILDDSGRRRMIVYSNPRGAIEHYITQVKCMTRFAVATWYAPDAATQEHLDGASQWCEVVKDHNGPWVFAGRVLYAGPAYSFMDDDGFDESDQACRAWLDSRYPDWKNPFAYWDAPPAQTSAG